MGIVLLACYIAAIVLGAGARTLMNAAGAEKENIIRVDKAVQTVIFLALSALIAASHVSSAVYESLLAEGVAREIARPRALEPMIIAIMWSLGTNWYIVIRDGRPFGKGGKAPVFLLAAMQKSLEGLGLLLIAANELGNPVSGNELATALFAGAISGAIAGGVIDIGRAVVKYGAKIVRAWKEK